MTISTGDRIPDLTLKTMSTEAGSKGPADITTEEVFKGKKVVLFAVPGAFTPGCSNTHLPGFVVNADRIREKGVDTIACTAVNDAFVLNAWAENQNAGEILMLADGNAELATQLELTMDASGAGMGTRSQRYAMIVEDGIVTWLGVEPGKGVVESSADNVLEQL